MRTPHGTRSSAGVLGVIMDCWPIADRGQPEETKRRVTVTLLVDQD